MVKPAAKRSSVTKCARGIRLSCLEVILIAKRLPFNKIVIMPKGQTQKVHGSLVNVPLNVHETSTQLPQAGSCKQIILVKHKQNYLQRVSEYLKYVQKYVQKEYMKRISAISAKS